MAKRRIAGILLVMLFICGGTAVASGCEDEYGNPVPCEQDPGGGGIGSGSCADARRGICLSQYSNYQGVECLVSWCEADPASGGACTTDTRPECYIGTDGNGDPSYVEVNVCTICPRGDL